MQIVRRRYAIATSGGEGSKWAPEDDQQPNRSVRSQLRPNASTSDESMPVLPANLRFRRGNPLRPRLYSSHCSHLQDWRPFRCRQGATWLSVLDASSVEALTVDSVPRLTTRSCDRISDRQTRPSSGESYARSLGFHTTDILDTSLAP